MNKDKLYFCPLGGSGEIGMNLNIYDYGKQAYGYAKDLYDYIPSDVREYGAKYLKDKGFWQTPQITPNIRDCRAPISTKTDPGCLKAKYYIILI